MSKDDGGPIFPVTIRDTAPEPSGFLLHDHQGMSLRDYFAGQAMTHNSRFIDPDFPYIDTESEMARLASRCYLIADAMIAERGRK